MAEWTTPVAVYDKCGEISGGEATLAIDEDTETYWIHLTICYHWIIFDMGESKSITKIQIYGDAKTENNFGQDVGMFVYISDNPEDFGDAVWEGALYGAGWKESDSFSKSGRYIKLLSKTYGEQESILEFDAYAEVVGVTYKVEGVTRNSAGAVLGGCTVVLFDADDESKVDETISDSVTGVYNFTGLSKQGSYYLRAYKSGSPNVMGTTKRTVQGEGE